MLLAQLAKTLVGRSLVVLHVVVPGICELDELVPLQILYFVQLERLPLLHLPHLPLELNFSNLLKLNLGLF